MDAALHVPSARPEAPAPPIPVHNVAGRLCAEYVLGTAQLGSAYGVTNTAGAPTPDRVRAMLSAAVDVGVTTVDTAAAYGNSEEALGDALAADAGLGALWPITKLEPLEGWRALDERSLVRAVRSSVDRSRLRLRLDRLPLLLLHRPEQRTARGGIVWSVLRAMVDEGRVASLGVSVYQPDDALAAIADPVVACIQVPINPLDTRHLDASVPDRARAAGTALFVRSVFLQGLLVATRLPATGFPAALRPYLDAFRRAARRRGRSPGQLAVAFARSAGSPAGLVLGAETVDQVRANAKLWRHPPLSADEREELLAEVGRPPLALPDTTSWGAA
jgi:aryl-alcohol dehydrogenase-like predicted oxidoreductase